MTQTVACLVIGGELAWLLMYAPLVTWTVASLGSVGELTWFFMCYLLMTQTAHVSFQPVSWPFFNVHSSGVTDCGLSQFSG